MSIVTRFAPSPTGFLHLGHAHAALTAHRYAKPSGRFLLRLEDIDPARCRPVYAAAIEEDLRWLGLYWDGAARVQSAHFMAYRKVLDALNARGLVYPCFCTRADIAREIGRSVAAPHAPDGSAVYPGICRALPRDVRARRIAAGEPHAVRLNMILALSAVPDTLAFTELGEGEIVCDPAAFGDVVLARKDAPASYHLCVVHDDAAQGVTLVTRGIDLKPATHLHRLLQALMGWAAPHYAHHRLLISPEGKRLAKRDGATSVRALRDRGLSAAEIRGLAGFPDQSGFPG